MKQGVIVKALPDITTEVFHGTWRLIVKEENHKRTVVGRDFHLRPLDGEAALAGALQDDRIFFCGTPGKDEEETPD